MDKLISEPIKAYINEEASINSPGNMDVFDTLVPLWTHKDKLVSNEKAIIYAIGVSYYNLNKKYMELNTKFEELNAKFEELKIKSSIE